MYNAPEGIKIDPAFRWAEAIGQSLHHAAALGLRPKVILYCASSRRLCLLHHQLIFEETVAACGLGIALQMEDEHSIRAACARRLQQER